MEKEGYVCAGLAEDETIPNILLLDIHLATESGIDLLKEVKEKYNSTKVIMVTADNTEETLQEVIAYGADALVTKPFLPQHIVTALDTVSFVVTRAVFSGKGEVLLLRFAKQILYTIGIIHKTSTAIND